MLKRVKFSLKKYKYLIYHEFLVCQLGYSLICKSNVSNEEKTSICPGTNTVNNHILIIIINAPSYRVSEAFRTQELCCCKLVL